MDKSIMDCLNHTIKLHKELTQVLDFAKQLVDDDELVLALSTVKVLQAKMNLALEYIGRVKLFLMYEQSE